MGFVKLGLRWSKRDLHEGFNASSLIFWIEEARRMTVQMTWNVTQDGQGSYFCRAMMIQYLVCLGPGTLHTPTPKTTLFHSKCMSSLHFSNPDIPISTVIWLIRVFNLGAAVFKSFDALKKVISTEAQCFYGPYQQT